MFLMLATGPLGEVARPGRHPIHDWARAQATEGRTIVVPEVADYELRRELCRAGRQTSLLALDILVERAYYRALDTPTLHLAAQLWAEVRAADRPALDGDVILAAQAETLAHVTGRPTVVVTDDPGRLAPFVDTHRWEDI